MMVLTLLLIFVNIWYVISAAPPALPQTLTIKTGSSSQPKYVAEIEESAKALEIKQDEFSEELSNISARIDALSGRVDTTQASCTCNQASENVEHEKALAALEEQVAELKEALLTQADTTEANSRTSSDAVRSLEARVDDMSTKSQETENEITSLTKSTASLTEFTNRVLYKVTAFISTESYADSGNRVSLRIDGSLKTYDIWNVNDQERDTGELNELFFHSPSLGSIDSVYIELHGWDGWHIDELTINDLYAGQIYTFDVGRWLDDDPAEQMSLTLPVTSTYTHTGD